MGNRPRKWARISTHRVRRGAARDPPDPARGTPQRARLGPRDSGWAPPGGQSGSCISITLRREPRDLGSLFRTDLLLSQGPGQGQSRPGSRTFALPSRGPSAVHTGGREPPLSQTCTPRDPVVNSSQPSQVACTSGLIHPQLWLHPYLSSAPAVQVSPGEPWATSLAHGASALGTESPAHLPESHHSPPPPPPPPGLLINTEHDGT